MENSSDEKQLEATSFVVHATRGVIRDQNTRRKAMLVLLALALLLLILGFTILAPALNPREHPWRVIFFWIACMRERLDEARLRQGSGVAEQPTRSTSKD